MMGRGKRLLAVILVITLMAAGVPEHKALATGTDDIVIVLDPGHDSTHAGAHKNGYKEESLVLKIAKYCKEELEKYAGVSVYLTREEEACAYGLQQSGSYVVDGKTYTSTELCNKKRVDFAAEKKADVFVSFHLNSNTSAAPNGAGVYYPNQNYRPDLGNKGKVLAQKIFENLSALGLSKWSDGTLIRNSENNTLYPDGSLADYLGVIRRSKEAGIPAVLIEHAFLSNMGDVQNFLNSEEKLKNLGIADATAIAEYFGLTEVDYPLGTAKVSVVSDERQMVYEAKVENIPRAYDVWFAVWSEKNGQDDLIWYDSQKNADGVWTVQIPVKNHRSEGDYNVHAYIVKKAGGVYLAGTTGFQVQGPTVETIAVQDANPQKGTFRVVVSGITSASGIQSVQVPVWTAADQNDIQWYEAAVQPDGSYAVDVDIAKHKYNYGNYKIHTYVTTGNGIFKFVGKTDYEMTRPDMEWEIEKSQDEKNCQVSLHNVSSGRNIQTMLFAVWSEKDGQDDLIFYSSNRENKDSWRTTIPLLNHRTEGTYYIHAYGVMSDGSLNYMGASDFQIEGPTVETIAVQNVNPQEGAFRVVVSGITSVSGIQKVQVPVWTAADQNDIQWYDAIAQADGTYVVDVNVAKHKYNYGDYKIHTYVTTGNGIFKFVGKTGYELVQPDMEWEVEKSQDEKECQASLRNVPSGNSIQTMLFAVWSESGGQDDLIFYSSSRENWSSWRTNIPLSNHRTEGMYYVHAYGVMPDGSMNYMGATSFHVDPIKIDSMDVDKNGEANGVFHITIKGAQPQESIEVLQVAVWSDGSQRDLKWYTAIENRSGDYEVHADIRNHNNNLGVYQIHAYAYAKNGIVKFVGGTSCTILNASTGNYTIMGTSAVNQAQLVRYYNANEKYPDFYKNSDAPTIEDFCQIYLEECAAEGVKAEVAFCQAMKETGFLRYLGDVGIEQLNFAGLDAAGRQEDGTIIRGRSYSTVREGVRAQVQRLKAWAVKGTTPSSYRYDCIDADKFDSPWWVNTIIGSAPCVEWLGKNENPSGYGWATDNGYGYSIRDDYLAKLLAY